MANYNYFAVVLVALMALALAATTTRADATLTCEQVIVWLTPCISYVVFGGTVALACCDGINKLNTTYATKDDIRAASTCVQGGAAGIPGIDYDRINELPCLCGISCPYKVYLSTNCASVVLVRCNVH